MVDNGCAVFHVVIARHGELCDLCAARRRADGAVIAFICTTAILLMGFMFWEKGGKIQEIVLEKSNTRYVRSATIIDTLYAFILYFFKELNNIPMSTTWVFVGLLAGRELAVRHQHLPQHLHTVFPLIAKDFAKMMFGLAVSLAVVLGVHYFIIGD